jgi:hypothetical protein
MSTFGVGNNDGAVANQIALIIDGGSLVHILDSEHEEEVSFIS